MAIKIRQQKQTQFLESKRTLVLQVSKGPLLPNYNNLLNTNKQKIINTKKKKDKNNNRWLFNDHIYINWYNKKKSRFLYRKQKAMLIPRPNLKKSQPKFEDKELVFFVFFQIIIEMFLVYAILLTVVCLSQLLWLF